MAQVEPADILGTLMAWELTFIETGAAEVDRVPEPWQPIVASPDPRTRMETAQVLWNVSLLDAMPQFAAALRRRFVDVLVCLTDDCAVLVYVATADNGRPVSWIGYDPRSFGDPPLFWDSFPEPFGSPCARSMLDSSRATASRLGRHGLGTWRPSPAWPANLTASPTGTRCRTSPRPGC